MGESGIAAVGGVKIGVLGRWVARMGSAHVGGEENGCDGDGSRRGESEIGILQQERGV